MAAQPSLSDVLLHVCAVVSVGFGAGQVLGHPAERFKGFHLLRPLYCKWEVTPIYSATLCCLQSPCVLLLSVVDRERLTAQPTPDEQDSEREAVSTECIHYPSA